MLTALLPRSGKFGSSFTRNCKSFGPSIHHCNPSNSTRGYLLFHIADDGLPTIVHMDMLHAFGNESAHHKTQNTHPAEIAGDDLAVCLFAIQRVLDFWFENRANINKIK